MPTTTTLHKEESKPTFTNPDVNRFKIDFNLFVPNTTDEGNSASN